MKRQDRAQFRYNGGRGALLCSGCKVIMKTGDQFTEEEISAIKGHAHLDPQYCKKCQLVSALNKADIDWKEDITTRDNEKYKVISFRPPATQGVVDVMNEIPAENLLGGMSPNDLKMKIYAYFKL